jgi:hypothetical protein
MGFIFEGMPMTQPQPEYGKTWRLVCLLLCLSAGEPFAQVC